MRRGPWPALLSAVCVPFIFRDDMPNTLDKQRVQLDLTPKMSDLLDDLVGRTDAASRAEVIRRAISIYNLLLLETEKGKRIEIAGPRSGDRERVLLVECH